MPPTRKPLTTRIALGVSNLISRTDAGPLRRLWRLGYTLVARAIARWVTHGELNSTAYVRGSVASGTAVHGISDIDLVLVLEAEPSAPGEARSRAVRRWRRALRIFPPLGGLFTVAVYEQRELEIAVRAPAPTFGLDAEPPEPLYHRPPGLGDPLWLRTRPGLYGATADWRRFRGPDRRPPSQPRAPQDERIAGWLELQWWWRHAIAACLNPGERHTTYLLVKLVSEPIRILLWLSRGERFDDRRAALQRGLEVFPEEEASIKRALSLLDRLPDSAPPPLAELLPALTRLSRRVAAVIGAATDDSGYEVVHLVGSPPASSEEDRPLPLVDWRSVALADPADETFLAIDGDAADPAAIAAASRASVPDGAYPALHDGGLLFVPMRDLWELGVLRTIQAPPTDPVSFALLAGERAARFPAIRGWSAGDLATRAISEHLPRLVRPPQDPGGAVMLALTAARAALLAESIAAGEPQLALTPLDVAGRLADRGGDTGTLAHDAQAWLREGTSDPPAQPLARDLLTAVRALPAYASAPSPSMLPGHRS